MKGADRFSPAQATAIRELLVERATAERAEQKRLRGDLRAIGFYISDWGAPGMGASDFDALVRSGQITLSAAARATPPGVAAHIAAESPDASTRSPDDAAATARRLAGAAAVKAARGGLTAPRFALAEAGAVPAAPGLYAIYGDAAAWRELKLGDPPDDRPLYVGKAEGSLLTRDVRTHFGTGRTGSSTVRRSLAALLRETLDLHAQARNPSKPERFANYGLRDDDDARLTRWMREHLRLAVWVRPPGVVLVDIERALLVDWEPPLNIKDVETPWRGQLSAARKAMASDARASAGRP